MSNRTTITGRIIAPKIKGVKIGKWVFFAVREGSIEFDEESK